MAYSVTSMQHRPDIGFKAARRHTAAGARELADRLAAEGALEIEITDDRGNLVGRQELARRDEQSGVQETYIDDRLTPR